MEIMGNMRSWVLNVIFVLLGCLLYETLAAYQEPPPPCNSNIFCYGDLLHTVQMSKLYKDSKTFVDKKLKYPPEEIRKNFDQFKRQHKVVTTKDIQKFVDDNFDPEGSEFEEWNPTDWKEKPAFLERIKDPKYQSWAVKIHDFWKELGRKIKTDVKDHPDLYSMIYVSNPVIVPGGRFREFFYWDSYWIMEGLLLSEMHETVKGMLSNFLEMVDLLGYVPNGGRVYFERSQPPLLIPMFKIYLDATNDVEFLKASMPLLVKEFEFWMKNRTVEIKHANGKTYTVARYNVELGGPRPESYREDYELAHNLSNIERDELYFNLKAGAESGWDYSSRWFRAPEGTLKIDLSHTRTRDISPVDLNSFLFMSAKLLAEFHQMVGETGKATEFENTANEWKTMINDVLWDETEGSWFDYDIVHGDLRKEFYPINVVPLWAGAQKSDAVVHRFMTYLKKSTALKYVGGVPTSLELSGEQWDFPNGWPPLQHLLVEALDQSGNPEAKELAFELAERWVTSNYEAFYQSKPNHMFEKYDVSVQGLPGGGGEYDVVVGFGWTNGVILDFLNRYGDKLYSRSHVHSPQVNAAAPSSSSFSPVLTTSVTLGGIIILLASLYGLVEAGRRLRSRFSPNNNNNCDDRETRGSVNRFPKYLYNTLGRNEDSNRNHHGRSGSFNNQTQLVLHSDKIRLQQTPQSQTPQPQIHQHPKS